MANTYTQLYVHVVFAVKFRRPLIEPSWKEELYKYTTGIITRKGQKLMAINGVEDHVHLLIGFHPDILLSALIGDIKSNSSRWINQKGLSERTFRWQRGYGAFTVSKSGIPGVARYIEKQEEHHRAKSFLEEYEAFLKAHEIDYDSRYVFHEPLD